MCVWQHLFLAPGERYEVLLKYVAATTTAAAAALDARAYDVIASAVCSCSFASLPPTTGGASWAHVYAVNDFGSKPGPAPFCKTHLLARFDLGTTLTAQGEGDGGH